MELAAIFEKYYDRVYSFTLFRTRNIHDAQDITSEVFFRAAKAYRGFDAEKASISTWLFTIAVNETKRHFGRKKPTLPLACAEALPGGECVVEKTLANERAEALYAAMERLDERQRSVLLLRYYGEMSNREIARALKLTETNVETILHRAKKSLKKFLESCEVLESDGYKGVEAGRKEAEHA